MPTYSEVENEHARQDIEQPQNKTDSFQKQVEERKPESVTQIINQNTINNFIIQNPEKVEVIEYALAKAQPIPDLKSATMTSLQKNTANDNNASEKYVKKLAPQKKVKVISFCFIFSIANTSKIFISDGKKRIAEAKDPSANTK